MDKVHQISHNVERTTPHRMRRDYENDTNLKPRNALGKGENEDAREKIQSRNSNHEAFDTP